MFDIASNILSNDCCMMNVGSGSAFSNTMQSDCDHDVMYFTSPRMKLFALDAETGKQEWMLLPYDSITGNKGGYFNLNNNRWRRLENKLRICTKSFWMVVY